MDLDTSFHHLQSNSFVTTLVLTIPKTLLQTRHQPQQDWNTLTCFKTNTQIHDARLLILQSHQDPWCWWIPLLRMALPWEEECLHAPSATPEKPSPWPEGGQPSAGTHLSKDAAVIAHSPLPDGKSATEERQISTQRISTTKCELSHKMRKSLFSYSWDNETSVFPKQSYPDLSSLF